MSLVKNCCRSESLVDLNCAKSCVVFGSLPKCMVFSDGEKLSQLNRKLSISISSFSLSCPNLSPLSSISPVCFTSLSSSSSLFSHLLFHLLFLLSDSPPLFPPLIRYLLWVDIFLSQVGISVFPLLNLFPAYVLFCQLFRDLVNICTERPAGNQPVGESSLCVNWSRPVCVWGGYWKL